MENAECLFVLSSVIRLPKVSVIYRLLSFVPSQFRYKWDLIVQKYSGVFLVEASLTRIIVEKDYKDCQQQFCWYTLLPFFRMWHNSNGSWEQLRVVSLNCLWKLHTCLMERVCTSELIQSICLIAQQKEKSQATLSQCSFRCNSKICKSLIVQVQGWEPGTYVLSFNPEWLLLILDKFNCFVPKLSLKEAFEYLLWLLFTNFLYA